MKTKYNLLAAAALAAFAWSGPASTPASANEGAALPHEDWSFNGLFGTFDRAQVQRGFQVFKEVCHSCHGLKYVAFRNLQSIGYSPEQVQAIAAEFEVQDGPNDEGDMFMRAAKASDHVPAPFANDQAARVANNGALPPDLSLIVDARAGGADYVHALMVGFRDPAPEGFKLQEGMYYNDYFPGHQIGMPPPLSDGRVEYADGTEATLDQEAKDVSAFLAWASEPNLEERKQLGVSVMLFLIVFTAILYAVKRKIWLDVHH
ncbi:MAG: cytochrome c1 [Rhodospirillales bacterium]|nr:cytochrome c1 [Rhodospirillales bacterium]